MIEVPKAFQGKPGATQALRLNALLSIIALGWTAFCIQHIVTGMTRMATTDAIAVTLTAIVCVWAVRSGDERKLHIAAHLAMVISTATICAVSMFSGQDAAMATWYLTAVPLFTAYALGTRQAIIWGVIALVAIVAVYVSPAFIRIEPEYVPNEKTWLMGKFVMLAVLLGLAVASRRATDRNVDALAQRELIIRERARELSDARDAALAAVRAKDEFLANMSHEIRTPLNGIIGMTSVLLDAEHSEPQREMVKTIQRSSTALLGVLNEILDFSKLEASAVVLESIPFDLRECVEDAIDLLGRSAFEKGLDVYVRMDPDVPRWIEGDITYLRQVLLNLIGNAVKFTENGEVSVQVSVEGTDHVHFHVRDTGIGIAADKHGALFRSFSQVDTSTTRKYGGTGLGLAISKRLIELMGGEIWVDSVENEGSTFHFSIAATGVEPPVRPMTTHERVTLIGHRAALIGGQPGSRSALSDLLTSWGMEVLDAPNWREEAPELVIAYTDALDELLTADERPPTIALMQLSDTESRERATASSVEAIVFRPTRHRPLRQAVEAVIAGEALESPPSFSAFDPTMGQRVPARILIGEDNPVNQRVAVTVLEKLGYAPDVAANGLEVLIAMRRRPYDILFLDLQMPGMDGLEVTRAIRQTGVSPWIVALTASVGPEQRKLAEDAGMNDFVSKPFDVQTLMVAIERWALSQGLVEELEQSKPGSGESPWSQLKEMFASAPQRLIEMVEEHRGNGAELVGSIVAADARGDLDAIAADAHALKSSAAQFGSDRVAELARELEKRAREGDLEGCVTNVERLAAAWARAEKRLSREVSVLEGAPSLAPERA